MSQASVSPSQATNPKPQTARLELPDQTIELPVVVGSENERAVDITQLRSETGYITLDPGYGNTGSCQSNITYIDGEKGILRYRGIPIEQIAENSSFIETAMLLIWGQLPTKQQREDFGQMLTDFAPLHEDLLHQYDSFPLNGHPMAILSAVINAVSCYHPELSELTDEEHFITAAAKLISKVRTIAAFSYRKSRGLPIIHPHPDLSYCRNFLHMMFSQPYKEFTASPQLNKALSLFLILHADHEQNCSTSTVRMVGSSGANLFASIASGVCALWGPLHGGANMAVIQMLEEIHNGGETTKTIVEKVKKREFRLMGFGHRVYKNFDPRARILKKACDDLFDSLGLNDPLLEIAKELEQIATSDEYFLSRGLYPNVDFYSGIILRTVGIPVNMFTVMFAIGRMPGWIANWYEQFHLPNKRIARPRQVYTGPTPQDYCPIEKR